MIGRMSGQAWAMGCGGSGPPALRGRLERRGAVVARWTWWSSNRPPRRGRSASISAARKLLGYLLGHVPIIDINPRDKDYKEELAREAGAQSRIGYVHPADERYDERSNVERVNAGLKDNCGGRHVRVRGHAKVHCHLMFAILALTVDQSMRLLT